MQPALNQHVRSDLQDLKIRQVKSLTHQCRRGRVERRSPGAEHFWGNEGPDLIDQVGFQKCAHQRRSSFEKEGAQAQTSEQGKRLLNG